VKTIIQHPIQQSSVSALPERLCISIGGHFGPSYSVTLKKGRLTYTYWPPRDSCSQEPEPQREEIEPSVKRWHSFRKALDRLGVWCWQANYSDPSVCDGTDWSVEIAYTDKAITSGGSNCFPDTFKKFSSAIASLLGREFH
jgi:hypothetical protein